MNKLLFSFLLIPFLLLSFPFLTYAANNTPNVSLLVSYKTGQSPLELESKLQQAKTKEATLKGFIDVQIQKMLHKKTQSEIIQDRINQAQIVEKKINIISKSKLSSNRTVGNQVYLLQLKVNTDTTFAIKQLKTLPEVESVLPNFILKTSRSKGSSIQSVETAPSTVQFLVKYKKNQAPDQIQQQVENRLSMVGQVSKIADVFSNEPSPEVKMKQFQTTWKKLNYIYSKEAYSTTTGNNEKLNNTELVTFKNVTETSTIIEEYKKLPEVEAILPNFMLKKNNVPNDSNYSQYMWNLKKIQAETAWDTTQGSEGIKIAVLDSGVDYNHEDLAANYAGGYDFSTCNDSEEDQLGAPPGTCLHPKAADSDPMDDEGHGTHVAGTITAVGNNNTGVTGVNWKAKILAVKVLGAGGAGGISDTLDGINYAVQNGAKVINMSLGSPLPPPYTCASSHPDLQIIRDVLDAAKNAGVTIVVSAGNENQDAANDLYSSCPEVIAVGATGPSDERTSYSSYGSVVAIAAPGGNYSRGGYNAMIPSTYPPSIALNPNHGKKLPGQQGYAFLQGTSMASPHVAGAAALLLSVNPNLTPDQIKTILVQNADPISTDKPIGPRLNLAKAVAAASGGSSEPTSTPIPTLPPGVTASPTPTGGEQPTATPTDIPTSTPLPTTPPKNLTISFNYQGIGNGGNSTPTHTQRNYKVELLGTNGSAVSTLTGVANYQGGAFTGTAALPEIPADSYQMRILVDGSLPKLIPGFLNLPTQQNTTTTQVPLTSGDVSLDGVLDIVDYNMLVACIQKACIGNSFTYSDLNDDNMVDERDLNILLRSFATRSGE